MKRISLLIYLEPYSNWEYQSNQIEGQLIHDQGHHHQIFRGWAANYTILNLSNYLSTSDRIHLEYEILFHLSHEKVKLADHFGDNSD